MKKTTFLILLLLILHLAHIIEEIFGNAWFIEKFYGGINNFIIITGILFLISLLFCYLFIINAKFSFYLIFIYSVILILDGFDHIIEIIVLKKYFNGVAGVFTGIGFIIIGLLFLRSLKEYTGLKPTANLIN